MNTFRWFVAETFMGWMLAWAPDDEMGDDLRLTLLPFIDRQLARLRKTS